jgi:hypothetical protein
VTRVLERTEGFRQLLGNILTVNAALVAQRQNDKLTPRVSQFSWRRAGPRGARGHAGDEWLVDAMDVKRFRGAFRRSWSVS